MTARRASKARMLARLSHRASPTQAASQRTAAPIGPVHCSGRALEPSRHRRIGSRSGTETLRNPTWRVRSRRAWCHCVTNEIGLVIEAKTDGPIVTAAAWASGRESSQETRRPAVLAAPFSLPRSPGSHPRGSSRFPRPSPASPRGIRRRLASMQVRRPPVAEPSFEMRSRAILEFPPPFAPADLPREEPPIT